MATIGKAFKKVLETINERVMFELDQNFTPFDQSEAMDGDVFTVKQNFKM